MSADELDELYAYCSRSLDELYHELYSYCSSAALTENGIHEIIERFGNQRPGKFDFFHAACRNETVTEEIIQCLLKYFPAAVNEADDRNGCLPLHYACRCNATLGLIELLIDANPDSVRHEDNNGFSPLHWLCANKDTDITEIIQCLLSYYPAAVNVADDWERLPLTYACENSNVSLVIIQLLIDAAPDSIHCEDCSGRLPLHHLCNNKELDKTTALQILKLLLEKLPESIHHAGGGGQLPIHIAAAMTKSTEFCSVLIEAYPGSEQIADPFGLLPFHCACMHNSVEIVDYLYNQYPDAIDYPAFVRIRTNRVRMLPIHAACMHNTVEIVEYLHNLYPDAINYEVDGRYPIHAAISSVIHREANPEAVVDIVKFLLDCDPRVKFQKLQGTVPLFVHAYLLNCNHTNIGVGLEITKTIYDAAPEEIEHDSIAANLYRRHPRRFSRRPEMRSFIKSQLIHSHQAKDEHVMTTPDDNGQLPLHTALQDNVRLGSIKLLVKGNPHAVQSPDDSGSLPLHVACMYESASVVQYLIELDTTTLDVVDNENNTALHYACRGAKYETIALLLDKYDAVSVSKRNAEEKLPIDVLCESDEVVDRESIEYTECVFQLLRAYPETVMNIML